MNKVCITLGDNLINYQGYAHIPIVDLTTVILQWNSSKGDLKVKYVCMKSKKFYINMPLNEYKYI